MKLKNLKTKTLFIYKSSAKLKKSGETDPTNTLATTLTSTGTGVFGI